MDIVIWIQRNYITESGCVVPRTPAQYERASAIPALLQVTYREHNTDLLQLPYKEIIVTVLRVFSTRTPLQELEETMYLDTVCCKALAIVQS